MSLEATLDELKEDALALARFYSKDFGTLFNSIYWAAETYLHNPTPEKRRTMELVFDLVDGLYSNIPFEELTGDERYAPLFVVNRLLPNMRKNLDVFLANPDEESCAELYSNVVAINQVGYLYRESFDEALEKVRAHPGGQDFKITLVGLDGEVFEHY